MDLGYVYYRIPRVNGRPWRSRLAALAQVASCNNTDIEIKTAEEVVSYEHFSFVTMLPSLEECQQFHLNDSLLTMLQFSVCIAVVSKDLFLTLFEGR